MKTDDEIQALVESDALDQAYADAAAFDQRMQAEAYDKALRELVDAARAVLSRNHRGADTTTERTLRNALEAFEPWIDGAEEDDPRAMGWVNDRGLP